MGDRASGKDAASADFEAFVRTRRAGLVSYLRRRVHSNEDVEDIVQESLIRLMRYQ